MKKVIQHLSEVRHGQFAGGDRNRARVAARLPDVCRQDRYSAGAGRARNQHSDHAAGRDDRPDGAQGRRRRRNFVQGLVMGTFEEIMSRVGKKPIPVPSAVKIQIGDQLKVQGPKGTLEVPIPEGISVEQKGRNSRDSSRFRRTCRAARAHPGAGRQRRTGRFDRLHARARHRGHRLSRGR